MNHMIVENKHTKQRCYHIQTEHRSRFTEHTLEDCETREPMKWNDEMFRKHWRWVDEKEG